MAQWQRAQAESWPGSFSATSRMLDESIPSAFADRAVFPEKQPRDIGVHLGGRDESVR